MSKQSITLSVGQAIPWQPSPSGFAQIETLKRRRVTLFYRTKHGKCRHATTTAQSLIAAQLLFEMDNPYNRGLIRRSKTFEVRP